MNESLLTITNHKTGQKVDYTYDDKVKISTKESREKSKKHLQKDKIRYLTKLQNDELGGFIFVIFEYCKGLTINEELTQSDLSRLFMLATFTGYDGVLMFDNATAINKTNMNKIINISESKFLEFYYKLKKLDILIEESKTILKLNKNYFFKGEIKKHKDYIQKNDYTRIYIKVIRDLYNKISARSHKQLGILFMLIPYINREWNILCENPNEPNINLITPLTLGKMMELLNYDIKNSTRIKNELLRIKTKDMQNIIAFVQTDTDFRENKILINPNVIYGGLEDNRADLLRKVFV